jgi:gliding motility-associatede transport system auxiliary component
MELKKRTERNPASGLSREILLTVLVLAILLFAVLNSVRYFTRIDLTESRAYSISDVSRNLFEEIPEEVQITYHVSGRLTERFAQPQEIIDLLSEYAAGSRGAITLSVTDPTADDSVADAEALGIVPQQLQVAEEGEQTFATVYSGIVVSYLGRFESIPFVFSTATLEYEITSTIRDLVADRTKGLRILVGYPDRTLDVDYSYAASQLSQSYDVRQQATGEPIPDGVDLLVVVGGENLSPADLDYVDEYLSRGGSVFMAVDSVRIDIDAGLVATSVGDAPVFVMLEEYGVIVSSDLVLD